MITHNIFHPTRFYLLVRNGVVLNKSAILIVSAAVGGLMLFLSAMDAFLGYRQWFHQWFYLGVLYLGGLIVTSRIFKEFHDTVKGPAWLLIPASLLEKASSRIVLSTMVYVVITMLIYFCFSLASEGFNWLLFRRYHSLFNPFDPLILHGVALYFVLQAPLLVGAVYFQKHSLSKTILAILGYTFVFFVVVAFAIWLIFGNYFDGLLPGLEALIEQSGISDEAIIANIERLGGVTLWIWRIIFWALIPPLCWAICYYRLKETER
ncbi:MAG: hypothetical protein ISS41_10590 [Candidatus Aminicenantes bacterium]|nr:hypothetical protein [Candidatus Aminicenantes bacterium]